MSRIELLNMDCMEYMAGCEDNAFDLAIVDPPYGIGESGDKESRNRFASNGYQPKGWDKEPDSLSTKAITLHTGFRPQIILRIFQTCLMIQKVL